MGVKRSPIIAVLGHVDHGKTTLLDKIRGTAVAKKESGGITQMIGASYIPRDTLASMASDFLKHIHASIEVPGILFIDTPGHAAFTSLRRRGGSLADLALLVVDMHEGFKPQTVESLEILKSFKTPFIVVANKLDLLRGWKSHPTLSFVQSLAQQSDMVKQALDERIYNLIAEISMHGFNAERFDRVSDFTKEVAIVPASAKTGEGIAEIIALVSGLASRYLKLELHPNKSARGSIMEVRREKGGTALDVILYDGTLRRGDPFIFYSLDGVKQSKVRALEIPDPQGRGRIQKDQVHAASGVRVIGPNLDDALPGSPFVAFKRSAKRITEELQKEMDHILFSYGKDGVLAVADSLGSLEALLKILEQEKIPVRRTRIGTILKEDILEIANQPEEYRVIFSFRLQPHPDILTEAKNHDVRLLYSEIIYELPDLYKEYLQMRREHRREYLEKRMFLPFKLKVLRGYIFRKSRPAIFGVRVLAGRLKPGARVLLPSGRVAEIKGVQDRGENISLAEAGKEVAVSCEGAVHERDFVEGDEILSFFTESEIKRLEEYAEFLKDEERAILDELKAYWRRKKLERVSK